MTVDTDNKLFAEDKNKDLSSDEALKLLVGEDAKYKTNADLAFGHLNGQSHINKIEEENAALKEKVSQAVSVQTLLDEVKKTNSNVIPVVDKPVSDDLQKQVSIQEDIAKAVRSEFQKESLQKKQSDNVTLVKTKLSEKLGSRAGDIYAQVGSTLGVNLDVLSKESPEAVISLVVKNRPDSTTTEGLQTSTVRSTHGGEILSHKAITLLFKEGKLTRDEKYKMQIEQRKLLGAKAFWS